ncbi:DNA (cytosine-5-)-methyltransferase [uncultured Veillonella sp.]|uniref:DNA (cytosine-5-)-methyltransferase n=1 Tax=uncultured Veillonella sp. TaxID=159268 RepID=UPI0026300F3C|nr:DNA (cytosine-5-)-methyltransferase [uncultured Veillonella sp.]
MKLTVAELFAGVGGFRVGLNHITGIDENQKAIENGSWDFVWANQYEPATKEQHAFNCYITRFGENNHSNIDIHLVDKDTIPEHSLLVGGFPCQDYSVARSLSNEQGIEGKKGVLFWDIKDVLLAKNPPFVLLENVDRLLKSPASQRGRDFAIMLKTFDELGYFVQWRVLNAAEYGMPQKRRRVFIFAYKKSLQYARPYASIELIKNEEADNKSLLLGGLLNTVFPIRLLEKIQLTNLDEYATVLDVSNSFKNGKFLDTGIMINGQVIHSKLEAITEAIYPLKKVLLEASDAYENKEAFAVDASKLDKWKYLKGGKKIERTAANGHTYIYSEGAMAFPEKMEEPARTMLTSEGTLNRSSHIVFDDELQEYRILTPVECELIQMFPKNWTNTMNNRKRYFMMGNALVTGIISRLEPVLREIISNEPR